MSLEVPLEILLSVVFFARSLAAMNRAHPVRLSFAFVDISLVPFQVCESGGSFM